MECGYGTWVWNVCMESGIWNVGMGRRYGMCVWNVDMECGYGILAK